MIVEQRLKQMAEDACHFEINRTEYRDKKIGVITSGIPISTFVRHFQMPVLKLVWYIPCRKLIEEFAAQETLYIVEELEPVIEEQGVPGESGYRQGNFTVQGEYSNMQKGNSA
ncbi:MAG: hypothetical protein ACLVK8_02240 [Ruminococcus sp.]